MTESDASIPAPASTSSLLLDKITLAAFLSFTAYVKSNIDKRGKFSKLLLDIGA